MRYLEYVGTLVTSVDLMNRKELHTSYRVELHLPCTLVGSFLPFLAYSLGWGWSCKFIRWRMMNMHYKQRKIHVPALLIAMKRVPATATRAEVKRRIFRASPG